MRATRSLVVVLVLLTGSCSSSKDEGIFSQSDIHINRQYVAAHLCSVDRNPQVINVIATQTITDSTIAGDVSNRAQFDLPTRFVSFYATRLDREEFGGRKRDISGLIGIGRASTLEAATSLAVEGCERRVDLFEHEGGLGHYRHREYSHECMAVADAECS